MTPSPPPKATRLDLFGIVAEELNRSVTKPNVLNYQPYPEQEAFHRCPLKGRYVAGGNRGGKTDAIVVDAIKNATNTNQYWQRPVEWGNGAIQLRFVVVDINKGVEQIILPKLKRWCAPSMLIDGRFEKSWDPGKLVFTFANGSTIDFLTHGMTLDKHGGVPRHIIYFDEEPPQDVFNENMMRLVDYDGYWVIAATPVNGIGWTYDLLWEPAENNPENGQVGTFTLSAEKNPYLQADNFDRFMIGMSTEERQVREEGKFVARSGLIFPQFAMNLDKFVAEEAFIPSKKWDWYTSTDFGYHNPTAWYWHAVGPQGQIITFAEHYQSEMTTPEHVAVVKQREAAFGKQPLARVGDPAGNQRQGNTGTSYISEYASRGIFIGVEGITNQVEIGIEKMQQYFRFREDSPWGPGRPTWIISPNCPNLIRELKKLRYADYSSSRRSYDTNKQEIVHKKDDHAFDSCRYFCTLMPDLTPVEEYAQETTSTRTISYQEMMARIANNPDEYFVEDVDPGWKTEQTYDDYYQEAY